MTTRSLLSDPPEQIDAFQPDEAFAAAPDTRCRAPVDTVMTTLAGKGDAA